MFENLEALDKNRHQGLKFSPAANFDFARELATAPLSFNELVSAARYYPVVFPSQGAPVPQALLSLKQGENVFIDAEGKWRVPYIPVHIRRYPFILSKIREEDKYAVCIDPDAPHFRQEAGESLYNDQGEPGETLVKVMDVLKTYQAEMINTERLFTALQEKGVLVDKQFNLEKNGQKSSVGGFKAVDTDKLKALDNDVLGDWVKRGMMGLVYAHLHSLDNVRALAGQIAG